MLYETHCLIALEYTIAIFLTRALMEILRKRCENCQPDAKPRLTTHRMRKIPVKVQVRNKILCTEAILKCHQINNNEYCRTVVYYVYIYIVFQGLKRDS